MAPRAYWTGHLRLSLVNVPVRLYPATTSERRIELNQIHEPSGQRIRYQKVVPGIGPVEDEDITKGYEYEKGKYVLIDQDEIDDLKLESKQTIELVRFVEPEADRHPLFREALLSDAGRRHGRGRLCRDPEGAAAGEQDRRRPIHLARPRQYRRDQAVRTRDCCSKILRHANEVKSATKLFEEIPNVKIDKEALELAVELMERKAGKFEPEKLKDDYAEAVWELINAKIEHRAPEIVTAAPSGAKVINIMDALKKSVASARQGQERADAEARRGTRAVRRSRRNPRRSGNRLKRWRGLPAIRLPPIRRSAISRRRPNRGEARPQQRQ